MREVQIKSTGEVAALPHCSGPDVTTDWGGNSQSTLETRQIPTHKKAHGISSYTYWNESCPKDEITNAGEDVCKGEPFLVRCWWNSQLGLSLWETVWKFLKELKIRVTVSSSNPTPRNIPKGKENTMSQRRVHRHVHGHVVYNGQDVESTQVSIDRWMGREVGLVYNGLSLSHQREGDPAICHNMDGTWGRFAKRSKSDKDRYHVISLICRILKKKKKAS